jgi:hypothetical protein
MREGDLSASSPLASEFGTGESDDGADEMIVGGSMSSRQQHDMSD